METEPIPEGVTGPLVTDPNARTWGMLAHLLSLLGYLIAFGHWIPPLVIYLSKKDEHEFIAEQARESLNFQITVSLLGIGFAALICVGIGIPLLIALAVWHLVMVIVASMQANEGKHYRYPFTLRLVN